MVSLQGLLQRHRFKPLENMDNQLFSFGALHIMVVQQSEWRTEKEVHKMLVTNIQLQTTVKVIIV